MLNSIKIQKSGVMIRPMKRIKNKLNNNFPKNIDIGSCAIFNVMEVFCSSSFTNALERPIEEEKNKESIKSAENISLFVFSGTL